MWANEAFVRQSDDEHTGLQHSTAETKELVNVLIAGFGDGRNTPISIKLYTSLVAEREIFIELNVSSPFRLAVIDLLYEFNRSVLSIGDESWRCPTGLPSTETMDTYNGHCYQFVDSEMYWPSARDYCRSSFQFHRTNY
ncbi:hypothetical protein LSAT2_022973 [Lamellibrachia satsuma]|nr:hypothetical protein LSAT2_022973 [Lamellibrachia satsuma]